MDSKFLENICEAYKIDRNLYEQTSTLYLFKEIYKSLYEIKLKDIETYNEFHKLSKLKQKNIVYEFLDYEFKNNEEPINEIGLIGLTSLVPIVGYILWQLFDIPKTKLAGRVMKDVSKFLGLFQKFGKWIQNKGRYWKFKYAILNQQKEEDFRRCRVHPNEITGEFYSYLKSTPNEKNISADTVDKAKCLREAFVNNLIKHIAFVLESYFVCLKKTGNFEKIENLPPSNIMETIAKLNLSSSCVEYHKFAQEQLEAFNDILDTIYDSDHLKQQKINQLVQKISKVKNKVSNIRNMKQYR